MALSPKAAFNICSVMNNYLSPRITHLFPIMKKLALLFIVMLISFVGFAQQKAKPLENFDDIIFQIHKSFLLDGEPDFGFMIIGLGSAEGVTLSADGDSISYRYRTKPFATLQQRVNEACEKGEEWPIHYPLDTKLKINRHKDIDSFKGFLQYIVNEAKPFRLTPITKGFNCYVCANGEWANISDGEYLSEGAHREIIELILLACQNNDTSILTEALQ